MLVTVKVTYRNDDDLVDASEVISMSFEGKNGHEIRFYGFPHGRFAPL